MSIISSLALLYIINQREKCNSNDACRIEDKKVNIQPNDKNVVDYSNYEIISSKVSDGIIS